MFNKKDSDFMYSNYHLPPSLCYESYIVCSRRVHFPIDCSYIGELRESSFCPLRESTLFDSSFFGQNSCSNFDENFPHRRKKRKFSKIHKRRRSKKRTRKHISLSLFVFLLFFFFFFFFFFFRLRERDKPFFAAFVAFFSLYVHARTYVRGGTPLAREHTYARVFSHARVVRLTTERDQEEHAAGTPFFLFQRRKKEGRNEEERGERERERERERETHQRRRALFSLRIFLCVSVFFFFENCGRTFTSFSLSLSLSFRTHFIAT